MDEAALSSQAPLPVGMPAGEALSRRGIGVGLTLFLCLLSCGVIGLMRWAENRALSLDHSWRHWQQLEHSLRVQLVYENEPRGLRWLSGYLSEGAFYREQNAYALAAEHGGYFSLYARQTMALVAHRAGDYEKAAYWRDGPPPGVPGEMLMAENRDALQQWTPGRQPTIASILESAGSTLSPTAAAPLYWKNAWAFSGLLVLGILLLPCGARTIHLLEGRLEPPVVRARDLSWRSGAMFGAWLRADWLFAFGGLGVTALFYTAFVVAEGLCEDPGRPWTDWAASFLREYYKVFDGWKGMVIQLFLVAGPVYLLARRFTGGVIGMWRHFGLGFAALRRPGMLGAAAGGVWITMMLMFLISPVLLRLGWVDPRDGWRFSGESLGVTLFYGCLVAPVTEELVFRGFLFTAFANRWSAPRAAVFSSLLFAVIHCYSWIGFFFVMVYGLLFCGLYRRTGSLWPPMLTHALINALMFLLPIFIG